MDRRTFLRRLGGAGAWAAAAGPLGVMNRARAAEAPAPLGRMAYQLSWIKNFQFVGEYIADAKGYYREAGLEVDLLGGGPNVIVDAVVASGKALVGQSAPDFMANAIAKGADLTCIGASYQKNNCGIASPAAAPLMTPSDLIGRKIGIQTINLVEWHAFLKLAQLPADRIHVVPVQYDLTPLTSGEVDGFFAQANDDVVALQCRGYAVHTMLFADFGYDMMNGTYSVLSESLRDPVRRAQIVAFMRAELRGWADAVRDPALGARLTTEVYGRGNGLDPKTTLASCTVTNDFMVSADTRAHGLFWMTPALVEKTVRSLAAAGIKASPGRFTNEILAEVLQGKSTVSS